MARAELINFGGKQHIGVNIGHSVGIGGSNHQEDVMLVQAMFKYISEGISPFMVGLDNDSDVPDITGDLDPKTLNAIVQFAFAFKDSTLGMDIKFDPAHYKNRVIKPQGKFMLITMLHLKTVDAQVIKGLPDYRDGLIDLKPELARYINLVHT